VWHNTDKSLTIGVLAYREGQTLDAIMERIKSQPGRKIGYERRRDDWFVLSGDDESGDKFYIRVEGKAGGLRGFSITYAGNHEKDYGALVVAMASSFRLLQEGAPADEATIRSEKPEMTAVAKPALASPAPVSDARRFGVNPDAPRAQMPDPWRNPSAGAQGEQ
jgi:hypothetical protein